MWLSGVSISQVDGGYKRNLKCDVNCGLNEHGWGIIFLCFVGLMM